MRASRTVRLGAAAALLSATAIVATGAVASASSARDHWSEHAHALFVETDASANSVISYARASDGSISYRATYSTDGQGATASGATADPLASQGGLALVDSNQELIATNPGSDTVSVFNVRGTRLDLVQQISTQGQFPVSVASFGDLVAVLNAGGAGSVIEYQLRDDGRLVPLNGQLRSLGLSNTTPPEFHHGAGQVGYSPNGKFLVVTTKLSSNDYDVFGVGPGGSLSINATSTASDNAVPFAFSFDSNGRLVGVEAATSSLSVYTINPNGALTSDGSVSDGGAALCWVTGADGYFFGSNAGSETVSSFRDTAAGVPSVVAATAASTHPGTTDSAASPDGAFLYVESGGTGALDAFAIGSNGSLTPIETLWNLPVGFEGIAVS